MTLDLVMQGTNVDVFVSAGSNGAYYLQFRTLRSIASLIVWPLVSHMVVVMGAKSGVHNGFKSCWHPKCCLWV